MGPSLMREYIVIDNSPNKLHSHFFPHVGLFEEDVRLVRILGMCRRLLDLFGSEIVWMVCEDAGLVGVDVR